ncbi:MAG: nicotinate-nucleotide adenylyltransferase [Gammaproteobacteria bacterium]|jgi:nicotinate-nucleotide adenylyltransferase|nr:nicotinate-nucleotide adenylyltransferase [Gammaproteobacteria bacterium]MBU0771259.1 nicotinate-nucleotide adenylyltransferase [Gammaproteobacteria bacterium]MBU0858132.1 nicotinate-nucleotide adenylyltransferase [Gammaproteobacteria bacterium]MBU1847175.1 nicotinate-nucleotide adenylyltransferase [Gammaproteobacteria bacterium]
MSERAPLGLFGGTFDPVHIGHLRLAEEARESLRLGRVRWIPAGQPWHRAAPQTSPAHRLEMVRRAVAPNPCFEVDAREVASGRPSYTVNTLLALRAELGGDLPLVLILGADAFGKLHTWHRWQELFGLAHIGLATRAGQSVDAGTLDAALACELAARQRDEAQALREAPAGVIVRFDMTPLAVSATDIRARLARGASCRYLAPAAVLDYISHHRLY